MLFRSGEDLGTVEPRVRETLADAGILGTKVAWFEHESPPRWPRASLATWTTHDLPTIAGVWLGVDGTHDMESRLQELTRVPAGALSDDDRRAGERPHTVP